MADGIFDRVDHDVIVVGAGFAGLHILHRLRAQGRDVRVLERAPDVGGTWYWNSYPGARCDVESLEYSYSFDPALETDWTWTERFATQPEIQAYAAHVADRYDLRRDIAFGTSLDGARWDARRRLWQLATSGGDLTARYLVLATGCLSTPLKPEFEGEADFGGDTLLTGDWPDEGYDFTGKRVGVIGTGSSGVQVIPEIAKTAGHLHVFQRTPHFCVPARNQPLTEERVSDWRRNFAAYREQARERSRSGWLPEPPLGKVFGVSDDEREAEYRRRWEAGGSGFMYAFSDIQGSIEANDTAAEFVRDRIRETVEDPKTRDALIPTTYPIGAKRICVGTDYYETYNRPNVTLVDVSDEPIERFEETGIRVGETTYPLDTVVFATGFDALTGSLLAIDPVGEGGMSLREAWADGPVSFMGVMVAGFPNMFTITGPGSPSVLSNVIVSIEQHVGWITDLLSHMGETGQTVVAPTPEAQSEWVQHCRDVADGSLMLQANSWYVGANKPGKPRVLLPYLGGVDAYRRKATEVAETGYPGLNFAKSGTPVSA